MVLATIDRIDDEIMVLLTHTSPVHEIRLPRELFLDYSEGTVVRLTLIADNRKKKALEKEISDLKKGMNSRSSRSP